jgi:hypothetical protein
MEDLAIARAIHVVAMLHWIGGVAFVTDGGIASITSSTRAGSPTCALRGDRRALFSTYEGVGLTVRAHGFLG